jgi:hypothetical protein
MEKKIVSLGVVISLVFLLIPVCDTTSNEAFAIQSWEKPSRENALMSHVVAKGNGTCISFLGTFFLGIGWCAGMVVLLDENGYMEITPLDDTTNSTILEGSHQLFIVGFVGLRQIVPQVNVNGLALLALWS